MEPQDTQPATIHPSRAQTQTRQEHRCSRCTANPSGRSRAHSQKRGSRPPLWRRLGPLAPPISADWFLDHVHFTERRVPTSPWIPRWPDPCLGLFLPAHGLQAAWIMKGKDLEELPSGTESQLYHNQSSKLPSPQDEGST